MVSAVKTFFRECNYPFLSEENVKDRPGHDRRYAVDTAKIQKLGWKPRHSFAQGIKKTVEWYVGHEEWWRAIKQKQADYQEWMKKQYGTA
jgi:dTDP-glucose 4,6-dehydratase